MITFQNHVPVPLWDGPAPLSKGTDPGDVPTIKLYQPTAENRKNKAVVILPGGAYCSHADHEGSAFGEFLAENGYYAFVVYYRLGGVNPRLYHHPAEISDAARAIRIVRAAAPVFGNAYEQVGIMGSSAGGHLAAHCASCYMEGLMGADEQGVDPKTGRPDFSILVYPVISGTIPQRHIGSFQNLLGKAGPSAEELRSLSMEQVAGPDTPRAFIWHGREDAGVPIENSLLYAAKLHSFGIPFELHIYEKGGHGIGLANGHPWTKECLHWLSTF